MKTRMKKLLAGMCAVLNTSHRFRANCSCRRAGTKLPDIRRKSGKSDIKTMGTVLLPKLILPNPAAANGCSNLCLSETGIWEI